MVNLSIEHLGDYRRSSKEDRLTSIDARALLLERENMKLKEDIKKIVLGWWTSNPLGTSPTIPQTISRHPEGVDFLMQFQQKGGGFRSVFQPDSGRRYFHYY